MSATFAGSLLGWRELKSGKLVPNSADSASEMSVRLAASVLDILGVARELPSGVADPATGRPLEREVAKALGQELPVLAPERPFRVFEEPRLITDFLQYRHLSRVDELARESPELRVTLGTDYLIKPDVVVSLPGRSDDEPPFLHAVVSCKWTIRSDRVQNIRHEYHQLIKHRRERLPHLVTVTAEPLPTRIASIVRGTGEVDATYHIAFEELDQSVRELRTLGKLSREQSDAWHEAVGLGRLRSFSELAGTLARW